MPRLSLTDFVDIVLASGTPKMTKVAQIKKRKGYNPAFDFYKTIRDRIVDIHRNKYPKATIKKLIPTLTDTKKLEVYPMLISGYNKWWGKKSFNWFEPPSELFSQHGVDIRVNPELGLLIDGSPYLVKLYFKAKKLTKSRIDIITHLMGIALGGKCQTGTVMSVLDVRQAKLISPTVTIPNLVASISAELAYISALWPQI